LWVSLSKKKGQEDGKYERMKKRSGGLKEAMIKMVKEMGEVGDMVACMVDESAGMGWRQGGGDGGGGGR